MAETTITVPLAHHLEWPPGSGEHHKPGDKLEVTPSEARSLVGAGMVLNVSPADPEAVNALLDQGGAGKSVTPDDSWTVEELQAELERLGQPKSGNKADLIERLNALPPVVEQS